MKFYIPLFFGLFLISCQNTSANEQAVESDDQPIETVTEPEETILNNTYCFVSTFGQNANYQDTTFVKLTIIGDEVTGRYDWIPAGKDSARGILNGTIENGIITAIYDYTIEGSQQKEEMIFKMEVNQLLVKKGELEEVGNILKLKDPDSATFSEVIPRVICR